jgi:hypothetical protein
MADSPACRVLVEADRKHPSFLAGQSMEAQPAIVNPVSTLTNRRTEICRIGGDFVVVLETIGTVSERPT